MEYRGSSDQEDERIVQVRQALMCPDGGRFEGLRTARFLNYTTTSIDDDVFELPLDAFVSSSPEALDPEKLPVKLSFSGWGSPSVNWIEWVNAMAESNAVVWRKSGVYDAIMASRYQITKQDDLMMALVEKWCIETNSFVFPWGEATVTLEDMIVLGGFSAIGNNVLGSIKRESMKSVEDKLKRAKREIEANSMKKCCVSLWMRELMNSGNEIEHEAFMVSWLSRFVFPNSADLLRDKLFAAAVQLARGVRLAMAPAVLAGIYSSLGVLKKQLVASGEEETVVITPTSPFQLVQVWAWERISEIRPPGQPSQLKHYEPRMAIWHQHGGGQESSHQSHENIRAVLDSAKESFDYRPYTKPLKNFRFPKFYLEDDCWVSLEDEDIVAFGRCLRCSKLVGLNCIEPYYPHRVALQFGYDQDVPGVVPVEIETPELAWKDYIRPISDEMMYIPSRLHQADVTVKYIRWWKQSVTTLQSMAKRSSQKPLKEKPAVTTTTTTAMVKSSPPRTSKTLGAKAELKGGTLKTVNDKSNGSSSARSLTGSEKADKQSKPLKKTEWIKKPLSGLTKSPGRSVDQVKEHKSGPKGSHEIKGHVRVKFLLPGSPGSSTKTHQSLPQKQNSKSSSPVIKPKALPAVPKGEKKLIKKANFPKPKDLSSSSSGSPTLTSKKSPRRSPQAISSNRISPSKASPALKGYVGDHRIKAHIKQESPEETRLGGKVGGEAMLNALKLLGEIVNLEEHVGEGGEVVYQIPKQQFEGLSQGVQDVLHELQSIKSALNMDKASLL